MKRRAQLLVLLFVVIGAVLLALPGSSSTHPFQIAEEKLSETQLLGKRLFEDTNLSEPIGQSCASCHEPAKAFTGNNKSNIAALALGSRAGHFGTRNVPALAYSAFSPRFHFAKEKNEKGEIEFTPTGGQFLDGRAMDLSAQVEGPLLHPDEMNNPDKKLVVEKVSTSVYAPLMKKLYGEAVFNNPYKAFTLISNALAAYETTAAFAPFTSKFDRVLTGRDHFTAEEARGFALFKDPQKGNCISCHVGDETSKNPRDWLFTDYTYDALGVPRNIAIPQNADPEYFDLGLCKQPGIEKLLPKGVTRESLCGAFKVPTLRNVATTAPYMHNGHFVKLRDAVDFYATRDITPARWYRKSTDGTVHTFDDLPTQYHENINTKEAPYDRKPGEKPRLNDNEIDAITSFLNTLTDE